MEAYALEDDGEEEGESRGEDGIEDDIEPEVGVEKLKTGKVLK